MKKSEYWFGQGISDIVPGIAADAAEAIENCLSCVPVYENMEGYLRDAFYADGTPKKRNENTVYPLYAAWYLGTPIPEAFMSIESSYSIKAAQAAISWAMALHGLPYTGGEMQNGLSFDCSFCNHNFTVNFPVSECHLPDNSIIIPIADTFRNDDGWGQSAVPPYVEQYARFLLWCHTCYANENPDTLEVPQKALVVRIIGNLSADVSICTIYADEHKDAKMAERVFRAFTKAQENGMNPLEMVSVQKEIPWQERRETELKEAYQTDDPELYQLIQSYMMARSKRKEMEAADKRLKAEADAIAIALAAQTEADADRGKLADNGECYVVRHTHARVSNPAISSNLVYQFAPQYAADVCDTTEGKVSVVVDVL